MVKLNSEGKGKRVLGRLGIPLATSYFFFLIYIEVLASATHRRKGREGVVRRKGKNHHVRKKKK